MEDEDKEKKAEEEEKEKGAEQWVGLSYVWERKWPPGPTSFTFHPFFETRPAFTFGPLRFQEEEQPMERQTSHLSLCQTGGSQQDRAAWGSLLFLGQRGNGQPFSANQRHRGAGHSTAG